MERIFQDLENYLNNDKDIKPHLDKHINLCFNEEKKKFNEQKWKREKQCIIYRIQKRIRKDREKRWSEYIANLSLVFVKSRWKEVDDFIVKYIEKYVEKCNNGEKNNINLDNISIDVPIEE